jgi:hypothetical protein
MDLIYVTLWFMVTLATVWDIRRTQLRSQAILERVEASAERIEQSAERIAQLTVEVLRRTPPQE